MTDRNDEDFSDLYTTNGDRALDFTQTGHAAYFVKEYGERVRWDWTRGKFYVFRDEDQRWVEDKGGLVGHMVDESVRKRVPELSQSKEGLAWLKVLASAPAQDHIVKLIKKNDIVGRSEIVWNPDPFLLGVPNGVVDLRTGRLRAAKPEDLINRQTKAEYKGLGAITKTWRAFISDIMAGDAELIDFLQRALGYSITGEFGEHAWFLGHGGGRNGKSLLLEKTVLPTLGSYAAIVNRKVLQKNRFADGTTGELLDLEGARYALASEFSGEIDEDRLKILASGGKMIGRRAYNPNQQAFESITKLWVDTNRLPTVNDDSEGFWRRLRALLFSRQFPLNKAFEKARMAEQEACLAWLVEGAMKYYKDGLPTPKSVEFEVQSFREESGDSATGFSRECVEATKDKDPITGTELYVAYKRWALAEGYLERELLRRRTFSRRMKELRPTAARILDGNVVWQLRTPKKK